MEDHSEQSMRYREPLYRMRHGLWEHNTDELAIIEKNMVDGA